MQTQIPEQPRLFAIKPAAAYLGTTVWCMRKLVWEKKLPHVRLGHRLLFDRADLDKKDAGWLESLPLSQAESEMKLTGVETDAALASLKRNRFQPKKYRWIHHDEWILSHTGVCHVRPKFVWENQSLDPLGPMLFAESEGLKWYPGMLVAPRAVYGSNEAVVAGFKAFVEALPVYPAGRRAWKKVQGQFCHRCAEQRNNSFEAILETKCE
jgi:excisionase family DNA binding protein